MISYFMRITYTTTFNCFAYLKKKFDNFFSNCFYFCIAFLKLILNITRPALVSKKRSLNS